MAWRNTNEHYGRVAILLHWGVALTVLAMFGSGLWMTSLNLYHPWYHRAPELHKAFGVVLFGVMVVRLLWRLVNVQPASLKTHTPLERHAARLVHWLIYLLLFALMVAGYLISTADGRPLEVFGLFSIPALTSAIPQQEDLAGELHEILAFVMLGLVLLHAGAALKHHYIDRDTTLRRMLRRS